MFSRTKRLFGVLGALMMVTVSAPLNVTAQPTPEALCSRIVSAWNAAHATRDFAALDTLYADDLLFYGSAYRKAASLKEKRTFFGKNPSFEQSVSAVVAENGPTSDVITCRFEKVVSLKGQSKTYPSYLVVRGEKIVTEGDDITDKNLAKRKQKSAVPPQDAISGDFNGDGALDYAWVESPPIDDDGVDCVGECVCVIRFSDTQIPSTRLAQCIGGRPDNLGDLNGRRGDEIGLSPRWFTSCWSAYHVWTLLDGAWVEAVKPISTHCDQFERGIRPIEADDTPGRVVVRSSKMNDDGIEIVTRSVPIRR